MIYRNLSLAEVRNVEDPKFGLMYEKCWMRPCQPPHYLVGIEIVWNAITNVRCYFDFTNNGCQNVRSIFFR